MRFFSAVSDNDSTPDAVDRVIEESRAMTQGNIDIVFVFMTAHHQERAAQIVEKLWLKLDPEVIVGCTAEGIIGGDREIERAPGLTLLSGDMPGVKLHPFHIAVNEWRHLLAEPQAMVERIGYGPETRAILGFGDPFSTPLPQVLDLFDRSAPAAPLVGGMASASRFAGRNALLKNDRAYFNGMVGVSLAGDVQVQTIVSQGCRPVGPVLIVTKSHDNIIEQLGGKSAEKVMYEIFNQLSDDDRELVRVAGFMIGRAISEYKENFGRGDFLVTGLAGVEHHNGSIALGDFIRTGQTVQFHVRDAATAEEDLALMLDPGKVGPPPAAALLFNCNGRGVRLFDQPNHDIAAAQAAMPGAAISGFFAAGEFGPVGGRNFVHGHTASFALLRPRY